MFCGNNWKRKLSFVTSELDAESLFYAWEKKMKRDLCYLWLWVLSLLWQHDQCLRVLEKSEKSEKIRKNQKNQKVSESFRKHYRSLGRFLALRSLRLGGGAAEAGQWRSGRFSPTVSSSSGCDEYFCGGEGRCACGRCSVTEWGKQADNVPLSGAQPSRDVGDNRRSPCIQLHEELGIHYFLQRVVSKGIRLIGRRSSLESLNRIRPCDFALLQGQGSGTGRVCGQEYCDAGFPIRPLHLFNNPGTFSSPSVTWYLLSTVRCNSGL